MSHISTDRLAAIADDTPTADEATHIAGCWDCRAELAAFRRLVRMAAMAPLPMEPLTAWSQLAPTLRDEGIIHQPAAARARRPWASSTAFRIAAGFALLLGGVAAGRFSAGVPLGGPAEGEVAMSEKVPAFNDADEALRVLTSAQRQYQEAASYLAADEDPSRFIGMNQDSYRARLYALDEIAAATRAALVRAPQDPMLNQYYLTTVGAREATLRQIGATLPETRRLERY